MHSVVRAFTTRSTRVVLSPTVNSRNILCPKFALRCISRVTTLYGRTAIVAPGIARTYFLAGHRVLGGPCGRTSITRLLTSLQILGPGDIVLAKISLRVRGMKTIYVDRSRPRTRCAFTGRFPNRCSNTKSLFADIINNLLFRGLPLAMTARATIRCGGGIVRHALGDKHRLRCNIRFRASLPCLVRRLHGCGPTR